MKGKTRILLPLDFLDASAKIVPQAIDLALKLDADIHLLFVVHGLEQYATFFVPHPSLDTLESELLKSAGRKLEDFEREHFEDYPRTTRVVLRGDPVETILNYIAAQKIDLVIIPHHGRQGIERIIFGSVAEEVMRNSPVPVVSINPYKKAAHEPSGLKAARHAASGAGAA